MADEEIRKKLCAGAETAFWDREAVSQADFCPSFVYNDQDTGSRVLVSVEDELAHCDRFMISVAFVTLSGITPLLQTFKELENRGISGKILTTDYLNFSEPEALDKLNSLNNIELRLFRTDGDPAGTGKKSSQGFHTKGWIFQREEIYHIIIGSSNMTARALTVNKEWNTEISGCASGEMIGDILQQFHEMWDSPSSEDYEECRKEYRTQYEITREQKRTAAKQHVVPLQQYTLQPNAMQTAFTRNLLDLVARGENKALLISATGTGKTFASAFGLRALHPRRLLFLVHREKIAKQAMESYQRVFGCIGPQGRSLHYALLSGHSQNSREEIRNADFLFAMVQTFSRDDVIRSFPPDYFSEICVDEAHHIGAPSYRKIMDYFKPRLWLGMTASPDTTRFNVYEQFDYHIACEIRLRQALQENLLCPFHYFGITDLRVDGKVIGDDDHAAGLRDFFRLVSDDRVDYILKEARYYGHSGSRVKGIVFCSRTEEAVKLSAKFNERGLRTAALTGKDSEEHRERILEKLAMDVKPEDLIHDGTHGGSEAAGMVAETGGYPDFAPTPADDNGYLDYVFAVDVLSEGVDVPEINQVIMLRPTESAVVFIQQLGRGLRKSQDKEFVVILDFIGNYSNNFLIPIALSGDDTYNKDNIRRYVMEGNRVIPGISTIHFDEISRKRIFASIDEADFTDLKRIKENYQQLKNKLGRIPALMDFDTYGSIDVGRIFDNDRLGSYYCFLKKYEPDYTVRFDPLQEKMIEFISRKLAMGKRPHELLLLQIILKGSHSIMAALSAELKGKYGIEPDDHTYRNVVNVMTNEFPTGSAKATYKECVFIEKERDDYTGSGIFLEKLRNSEFRAAVAELAAFGLHRFERDYRKRYQNTSFTLYQKYTYEDVCRLLNWEHNVVPLNIGGYKYDKDTQTFPVFINYEKDENISATTKYEDHFIDDRTLIAISKSKRTIRSSDVQNFLHAKEKGIAVHLFVRKNKDDKISKNYYYLGTMTATGKVREFTMADTTASAVEIEWKLDSPVRRDLYDYITN